MGKNRLFWGYEQLNEEGVISRIIHGIAPNTGRMAAVLLAGAVLFCAVPRNVYAFAAPTAAEAPAQDSSAQAEAAAAPTPEEPPEVSTNTIAGWPQGENCRSLTACLIDADTGAVLYDKSMGATMAPASITKVMTLLLALERGNLEDRVTMTETGVRYAESGSMNLYTKVGEEFTVEELIYGTFLYSANDMATQLGEYIGGGSIDNFVQMMNDRAAELGCTGTHFANACGMPDPEHVTTAHDMALIMQEGLRREDFRIIINTPSYTIPPTNMTAGERELTSHNPLLVSPAYFYPGTVGGKTGYTDGARHTLINGVSRDGMTLIVVTMHAEDAGYAAEDNIKILDYGFNNFAVQSVGNPELTAGGGKVTLPKGVNIDACTIEEQDAGSSDAGEMVNWIYRFNGQRVGNLLMTKENAAKYKKELDTAKKTESKESKDTDSSAKTGDTEAKVTDKPKENTGLAGELDGETFRLAIYILGGVVCAGILVIIITLAVRRRKLKKKIQAADEAYIIEQKDSPAGLPVDAEALAVAEKAENEEKSENAAAGDAENELLKNGGVSESPVSSGNGIGADVPSDSPEEDMASYLLDDSISVQIGDFISEGPAWNGEDTDSVNKNGN